MSTIGTDVICASNSRRLDNHIVNKVEDQAPSDFRRTTDSIRRSPGQQPPRDVRRLIEDVLSSGKPLHEIEDYLDWLENTCPSHRI